MEFGHILGRLNDVIGPRVKTEQNETDNKNSCFSVKSNTKQLQEQVHERQLSWRDKLKTQTFASLREFGQFSSSYKPRLISRSWLRTRYRHIATSK